MIVAPEWLATSEGRAERSQDQQYWTIQTTEGKERRTKKASNSTPSPKPQASGFTMPGFRYDTTFLNFRHTTHPTSPFDKSHLNSRHRHARVQNRMTLSTAAVPAQPRQGKPFIHSSTRPRSPTVLRKHELCPVLWRFSSRLNGVAAAATTSVHPSRISPIVGNPYARMQATCLQPVKSRHTSTLHTLLEGMG